MMKHLNRAVLFVAVLIGGTLFLLYSGSAKSRNGQEPWSTLAADEMLAIHPHYINYDTPSLAWNYEQGMILYAIWNVWQNTKDQKYFDYVNESVDFYLNDDGTIKTYNPESFRLDDLLLGRVLLNLYQHTKLLKYKVAAATLRDQIRKQPRTSEGGFWHKKIYPNQMWLDGLYMAEPFYVHYARMFDEPKDFDDIADQFILMAQHSLDSKTGLMYHGWDFSKKEKWCNPKTGDSPTLWGRAIGWYMMGLVDVVGYFPKDHPKRQELVSILRSLAKSLLRYQDKKTHLWYQVVDHPGREGNYLESSASAMFAYSFAKGARKKFLDKKFLGIAREVFDGLVKYSSKVKQTAVHSGSGPQSDFVLMNTCGSVGLGGDPYRDGSYEYYVGVPKENNDFRGVGPFILAALELERSGAAAK